MMGNEVALWETMLAAIKIGAVLIPAAPQLAGADLLDRLQRGKVHHVLTNAAGMVSIDRNFAGIPSLWRTMGAALAGPCSLCRNKQL